jgi:hypothetical protein
MASLNFNASTVEPTQSYEPLPEGWYPVIMTKSEMKPTKDGTGAYLETELTVQDGACKGRKVFYRLNLKNSNPVAQEIAYRQLSAICHAVGVIQVEDSQQLHGLPFQVKVVVKKDDSGKYDPSNEVKAIKGMNEGAHAPAVGFTAPAAGFAPAPAPAPTAAPVGGSLPPWMQNK